MMLVAMVIILKFVHYIILVFIHIEIEKIIIMMFKIFSSKYYPLNNNNNTKTPSELISLITEQLSLDNNEQFSSIPIINNEEIGLTEEDKHE